MNLNPLPKRYPKKKTKSEKLDRTEKADEPTPQPVPKTESAITAPAPKKVKQRRKIVDETGFWTQFLMTLKDDNLPLMLLVRDVQPLFENSFLSLDYSRDDALIYHFAIEDHVESRISGLVSEYRDELIRVGVILEGDQKITKKTDRSFQIDKSEIMKWDKLINENFMTNFPEGNLKWEER